MKRFALLAAFGLLAAAGTNPHFIRASADLRGEDLVVKWKEAGLGDNQNIDYVASADATGFYACINGGQNHPQAANKEAFEGPVTEEGTFNSGKNGHITASLTISPPQGTLLPSGATPRVGLRELYQRRHRRCHQRRQREHPRLLFGQLLGPPGVLRILS